MKGPKKTSQKDPSIVPGVDLGQLERLLAFMSEHGLEEFEYAHGDLRIRLKKALSPPADYGRALPAAQHAPPAQFHPAPVTVHATPPAATAPVPEPAAGAAAAAAEAKAEEELHVIKSPIVGTFYAASGPDAGPFVKVGDVVEVGQTVCIVEAMKLMNEIESDFGGEVVRIMVENGQPVEYGEPLFALRPSSGKKK